MEGLKKVGVVYFLLLNVVMLNLASSVALAAEGEQETSAGTVSFYNKSQRNLSLFCDNVLFLELDILRIIQIILSLLGAACDFHNGETGEAWAAPASGWPSNILAEDAGNNKVQMYESDANFQKKIKPFGEAF